MYGHVASAGPSMCRRAAPLDSTSAVYCVCIAYGKDGIMRQYCSFTFASLTLIPRWILYSFKFVYVMAKIVSSDVTGYLYIR